MELIDEIEELIMMHQEGPYWDFKREWYDDSKDGDLLIDIICMANNLVDRDAYIIIGVNEECDYAIQDVSQDANRRNTQMLTDFIRGKKFAGDFRPVVTVEQVHLDGGLVDVIVVHNSINTPYYLKEKYKGIFTNNIYVRLQDSNTPVDKSADFGVVVAGLEIIETRLEIVIVTTIAERINLGHCAGGGDDFSVGVIVIGRDFIARGIN